jgi:hypothetical protein
MLQAWLPPVACREEGGHSEQLNSIQGSVTTLGVIRNAALESYLERLVPAECARGNYLALYELSKLRARSFRLLSSAHDLKWQVDSWGSIGRIVFELPVIAARRAQISATGA